MTLLVRTGPAAGSFHGRASRGAWYAGTGLNGMLAIAFASIPYAGPVLALPWLAAMVAVSSRRLHDIGRSGVWQAIPWALAAMIVAYAMVDQGWSSADDLWPIIDAVLPMLLLVFVPFAFCLGILRGTNGPNAFGESAD